MSTSLRPSLVYALSTRGPAEFIPHLRKNTPRILDEMSALAPASSASNLRTRYEELSARFSACSRTDSRTFDPLVREALKDAGKCGLQPTAMDSLSDFNIPRELKSFLERRIALRFLMSHYATLQDGSREDDIGVFERDCKLSLLCRKAAMKIQLLCMEKYKCAPKIKVEEIGPSPAVMTTVPQPISYIMCELIKNSAKASIKKTSGTVPQIEVHVEKIDGKAKVSVVDSAGGLPKSKPFDFPAIKRDAETTQLSGFGVGLPISRLYARYFEGDLTLQRTEFGMTANLWIPEYANTMEDLMSSPCFLRNSEDMHRSLRQVRF